MMTVFPLLVAGGVVLVAWNLYAAIAAKNDDPNDGSSPVARLHLLIAIAIAGSLVLVLNSMHS